MKHAFKRILLIDPPVTRPKDFSHEKCRVSVFVPLGLAYIAAVLEKAGYQVTILDALVRGIEQGEQAYGKDRFRYGLSDAQIEECIRKNAPDVVGISCLFSNKDFDLRTTARIVKKVMPDCPVIAGGVHPTAIKGELLKDEAAIDYIVLGEGEYTLKNLLRTLESGKPVDEVDGIVYRDGHGRIIVNEKKTFIQDLDELPFPARHLLDMKAYNRLSSAHSGFKQKPYASLISSRGCPAKCTFCSIELLWGKVPRYRSAENILAEIAFLQKEYGVREVHFEDDNLTSNKKRALAIFNGMIERKFNLSWTVPSGLAIYSLDGELLEKMAESGCYSISLAIESGDQAVLDTLMNKPIRLEKAKPLVDKARSLGMKTKGFFILGFPGETQQTMRKTIAFAKSLELDWSLFFMATPLIGTKIYQICKDKHYLKDESVDFARSFYVGNIKTESFDTEDVEKLREEANLDLNFRNNPNLLTYDLDEAINDFKAVLQFYPHLWFAHFYLGEAFEKKGSHAEAVREWKKALALNPSAEEMRHRVRQAAGQKTIQRQGTL